MEDRTSKRSPDWSAVPGTRLATTRGEVPPAGNLGGWQVSRALFY